MKFRTAGISVSLCLALSAAVFAAPAVEWQSQFGGPNQQWTESVLPVTGGYLVSGSSLVQPGNPLSGGRFDYYLSRIDAGGAPVWQKTFSPGFISWGGPAVEAADGGFVMVGTIFRNYSYYDAEIGLIKTDADGNLLWTRIFEENQEYAYTGDNTYGQHVQRTTDGGFIVLGLVRTYAQIGSTILLIRTDADGNELWRSRPGASFADGAEVRQTADGGFAVGGGILDSDDAYDTVDFYLLKTDSQGKEEWSSRFGLPTGDSASSFRQTADGGFILHGTTGSFDVWNSYDQILAKADASGNLLWIRTWGGLGDDWGGSVIETADGGFVTTGTKRSEDIGPDGLQEQMTVTRFSPSGVKRWEMLLGDSGTWMDRPYAEGFSIEATADGGAVVGGLSVGTDPASDGWGDWEAFVVKLGPIPVEECITVSIDIMPGSSQNPINLGAQGTVPVAVLSTPSFNASTVAPETVLFAGAPVATKPNGKLMASLSDIDRDGDKDLVLHFRTQQLALKFGDTSATLTGLTRSGDSVQGSDRVAVKRASAYKKRK